ncbi:MAG: DNA-processing protein DprA [Rikenellaceae bacterium]
MGLEDIALTMTPGLGVRGAVRLLEVFSSAERIFGASREELIHFAELNAKVADAVVGRVAFAQARKEMEYCRRHNIVAIASTDEAYPPLLREVADYPHVIYVMGNPAVLKQRGVSVVGTRRISSYGDRACVKLVKDLHARLSDVAIVSGLAFGVDSSAHRAAVHFGVPTVAVVPCALPGVVPTQHTGLAADIIAGGGAILSECHSQTKQRGNLYLSRNRIIAALSEVTVVVESPLSGGSIFTANTAHGYERLVEAMPGRLFDANSAGCNMLINRRVALLYTSADDLIRELMWDGVEPSDRAMVAPLDSDLSPAQLSLIKHFEGGESLSIEELCDLTQLAVSELAVMVTELELLGHLHKVKGNRYELLNVVVAR